MPVSDICPVTLSSGIELLSTMICVQSNQQVCCTDVEMTLVFHTGQLCQLVIDFALKRSSSETV